MTTSPSDAPADEPPPRPGGHDAIRSRCEDQLDRAPFAERITRQIALSPVGSSVVLAVAGSWGSGKTSLLNMVTEVLGDTSGITVIEFNPWLFSSPEELVSRFFAELSSELMSSPQKKLQTVGAALQRYGTRLAPVRFLPGVGDMAGLVARATSALGDSLVNTPREPTKSLKAQHRDLAELLRAASGRIVIVLDDIDRLRGEEIREVMRLVRLTSDLPNVTFLLAFDRTKVEVALTEAHPSGDIIQTGRGYLEKIIQAPR